MKSKKLISGLLALTFVFGGAVVPNAIVDNTVISASAENNTIFFYSELNDGTVYINSYSGLGNETDLVIPSKLDGKTVSKIGPNVFSYTKITSVTIPDTVKSLEYNAFAHCSELKKVNLPNGLVKIGSYAFSYCKSLENITLPEGLLSIEECGFYECSSLKSIEIPASLVNIGNSAFNSDKKLGSLSFAKNSNLKNIGRYAFYSCESLEELHLPDSIAHIGENAFCFCTNLKELSLPNNSAEIEYGAFSHNPGLTSIEIPKNTKIISDFEFGMCDNLKEVTIPASVTSIGTRAFGSCSEALKISCYKDTAAHKYALDENIKFILLDETDKTDETEQTTPNCPPPIRVEYSEKYHQIRIKWTPVDGAEKYGIAVYLAGKWRIQTQDIPADIPLTLLPRI